MGGRRWRDGLVGSDWEVFWALFLSHVRTSMRMFGGMFILQVVLIDSIRYFA